MVKLPTVLRLRGKLRDTREPCSQETVYREIDVLELSQAPEQLAPWRAGVMTEGWGPSGGTLLQL